MNNTIVKRYLMKFLRLFILILKCSIRSYFSLNWIRTCFSLYFNKHIQPLWISYKKQELPIFFNIEEWKTVRYIYKEIVVEDCYGLLHFKKLLNNPEIIVDLGSNIGIFSAFCSILFPNTEIIAFEPNPKIKSILEKNITKPNIKIFFKAVTNKRGFIKINNECDSGNVHISNSGNILVPCIPCSEIAEGKKIDLLKLDVEGSEWEILNDKHLLERVRYLRMEYHLPKGKSLNDLKVLIEKGGHKIEMIEPTKYKAPFFQSVGTIFSSMK